MNRIINTFEHRYYSSAMLLFSVLYGCFFLINDDVAKIFQVLIILGSLPIFVCHRRVIFKDPMIKILGAVIIAQILSWLYASAYLSDIADANPKIDRLAKLFSFFLIAYWLKGKISSVCMLWGGLAIGFIIGCMLHPNFTAEVSNALSGTRIDFGMKNAQFTTMLAGSSLLITSFIIYLYTTRFSPFTSLSKRTRTLIVSICSFSIVSLVFIAVVSQSRQVWLALAITSIFVPIYYALVNDGVNKKKIYFSYLALCIVAIGFSQLDVFQLILQRGFSSNQMLLTGNISALPMDSTGIRIHSWIEAIKWIKQSPIVGNDNAAIGQVIQQSDLFSDELKSRFSHLHSYHIETLVAYGFIGLGLVYLMYYWMIRSLFIQKNHQPEITPFLWFALAFTTYWFIVNGFETFNSRSMGVYVHNIMFAGFYTFYLTHSLNKQEN